MESSTTHLKSMLFEFLNDSLVEDTDGPKDLYSITVTVYEANNVAWDNLETRVCVKLGKTKKYTKVKQPSNRPHFNEYFTFEYEGNLMRMLDMVLVIAVQNYRPKMRCHKLLGSARLDIGAIWTQPGHCIADKWILLTHPSDPTGHIRGYINCEICIIPSGESIPIRRFTEPKDFLIPQSQGGGKLKARYIFRIHRGIDMFVPEKSKSKSFIRVYFAGLAGETTRRKHVQDPIWREEIVFTELFPPMYNRIRIDIHFGKKQICSKFLNLSDISDPTVKGYLPTYGPSFLYLYNPPYEYLGALLVSLETLTVQAFRENDKLLGVKRQRTQDIIEKMFWKVEDFVIFGVIYEISMLSSKTWKDDGQVVVLGFSASERRPFNDNNMYISKSSVPIKGEENLWHWPKMSAKPTIYTREKMPDHRHRLYMSNRLLYIAKTFGEDLAKIRLSVEASSETSKHRMESILKKLIENCEQFKVNATVEKTVLDNERFKNIVAKLNKIIKLVKKVRKLEKLDAQFQKCIKIYKDLVNFVRDPQESFPKVILKVRSEGVVQCYAEVHPRDIVFSTNEKEKGMFCGKIQTIFLKKRNKNSEEEFAGKMDILLWFGPYLGLGYGIASLPAGYHNISHLTTFPTQIFYKEVHYFTCRVHLYQGHFMPCDAFTGTCSVCVRIHFDCQTAESSIKDVLSPVWMETLVIRNVKIYGNIDSVIENPPQILFEVWNFGENENKLLGRHLFKPTIFLDKFNLLGLFVEEQRMPIWYQIHQNKHVRGEILAMIQMFQEEDYSDSYSRLSQVIKLPNDFKYPTFNFKLEVLLWGLRSSRSFDISSLNNPVVIINCGLVVWKSLPIKNPSAFPNFNQPIFLTEIEVPKDWRYAPPFVLRLFDSSSFGTQVFIGSFIVRNINRFVRKLFKAREFNTLTNMKQGILSPNQPSNYIDQRKENTLIELVVPAEDDSRKIFAFQSNGFWSSFRSCCQGSPKADETGYISLGLLSPFRDPDVIEEFFDWWTKYFDSLPGNSQGVTSKINYPHYEKPEAGFLPYRTKTAGLSFYTSELEAQPEFEGFKDMLSTFKLQKNHFDKKSDAGFFKGSIALYKITSSRDVNMQGDPASEGLFASISKELGAVVPLLVRVYIVRAHQLRKTDRVLNPFIEVCLPGQRISDIKNYLKASGCNPIFGRSFELDAKLPYDSILRVRVRNKIGVKVKSEIIGETEIDIENRYYSRHRGTCGLQRVYVKEGYNAWRDSEKPTEILHWKCLTNHLPLPDYRYRYVNIGGQIFTDRTGIRSRDPDNINENLALSALLEWEKIPVVGCKLVDEHVETRPIYSLSHPGVETGKLEMWVDLLPGITEMTKVVDISPRIPQQYQLRAIVWSTQQVRLTNVGTLVGKKNTDIFVKGWLKGKEDLQKTDVHFSSLTGEGSFNWRFIFDFAYDRQEKMILIDDFATKIPPILHLQVWDLEKLRSNEYLGCLSIDLRDIPPPSKRFLFSKKFIPLKGWHRDLFKDMFVRGYWPFLHYLTDGTTERVGMVDLELSLLTAIDAERSPAGHGRNEPDGLPDPVRPVIKYTVWIVPFRAIKNFLWKYHKYLILKGLFYTFFGFFILIGIYAMPNYSIKKIIGA